MNRAAVGKEIGGALNVDRLLDMLVERHHTHGRTGRNGGGGGHAERDLVGDKSAKHRVRVDGDSHRHGLGGKIDIDERTRSELRLNLRGKVGVKGGQGDGLLVAVGRVAAELGGGSENSGVGHRGRLRFDFRGVRHVDGNRGRYRDRYGAHAEHHRDRSTHIPVEGLEQTSPRSRNALHQLSPV